MRQSPATRARVRGSMQHSSSLLGPRPVVLNMCMCVLCSRAAAHGGREAGSVGPGRLAPVLLEGGVSVGC